uniref:ACT domain-containing protein n=1 Tax=Phaeomonas parva TaxID=124430 RepID=A0A7S1XKH0_9STRA
MGVRDPAPPLSPKAAADGDLTLGEVRLVGRDAPGLVFKLTRALAAEAIGVERMQTERVRVPAGTSVALFRIPSPTRSAGEPSPKPRGSFTDADTDVFILHGAVSTHGVPAPGIQPALRSLAAELDVSVVLEWERP